MMIVTPHRQKKILEEIVSPKGGLKDEKRLKLEAGEGEGSGLVEWETRGPLRMVLGVTQNNGVVYVRMGRGGSNRNGSIVMWISGQVGITDGGRSDNKSDVVVPLNSRRFNMWHLQAKFGH
ncbi:hypothetical protein J6590_012200 [Homalodisca vitripennis]|nr:hypothetical protein J6590_012200 [Homalodisca vitripennis]